MKKTDRWENRATRLDRRLERHVLSVLRRRGVDGDHAHKLIRVGGELEELAARAGAPPGIRGLRELEALERGFRRLRAMLSA